MTYEELREKQETLDMELTECPRCGRETTWGEVREFRTCMECYSREEDEEVL